MNFSRRLFSLFCTKKVFFSFLGSSDDVNFCGNLISWHPFLFSCHSFDAVELFSVILQLIPIEFTLCYGLTIKFKARY